LSDGIVEGYSYDNANRLTGIGYSLGATTLGNLAYGPDTLGRVSTALGPDSDGVARGSTKRDGPLPSCRPTKSMGAGLCSWIFIQGGS
jgi:hypothetical protein